MTYWIMRSEPDAYSWDDLVRDHGTEWDGVRNYTARIFLKEMEPGDHALFYHSQTDKAAVGVICGLGVRGYALALMAMADLLLEGEE